MRALTISDLYHFTSPCLALNISYPSIPPWNITKFFLKWNDNQQIKRPPQKLLFPCVINPCSLRKVFHLDCVILSPKIVVKKKCNVPPDWYLEYQSPLITTSLSSPLPHIVRISFNEKQRNRKECKISIENKKHLWKNNGLVNTTQWIEVCMFDLCLVLACFGIMTDLLDDKKITFEVINLMI